MVDHAAATNEGGGGGGGQMMKRSGVGVGVGGDNNNEQVVDKDSMRMLRVWDVKKCDPTVPVFRYSMSRRLAAIQPRYEAVDRWIDE